MSDPTKSTTSIPLVAEQLTLDKRTVETGRVRIRTVVHEQLTRVEEDLMREDVSIERVPVNQEVTATPPIREEGDVLVVPLVEEVIVVEKRLIVREELHIRRSRSRERVEKAVHVRGMRAQVDRVRPSARDEPPVQDESSGADESMTQGRRIVRSRLRRKQPPQPR